MGSIKVLTEVLSIASPDAFGRSMRIARYVRHVVDLLGLPSPWQFEVAAMLSQLGCVTLDPELIRAAFVGEHLSSDDQERFDAHPQVAQELLIKIPRMELIAWMISQQLNAEISENIPGVPASSARVILLSGARILKLAVAFDSLVMKGVACEDAILRLRDRNMEFEPELIDALASLKPDRAKMELRKIPASMLTTSMILQQEVLSHAGMLVVPKGQEITHALLIKLINFSSKGMIDDEFIVLVPV
jgi:response regulator RpfG family c-di-GMP phosphodiesterase